MTLTPLSLDPEQPRSPVEKHQEQQVANEPQAQTCPTKILESISDVFYAVDARFCFTYVNQRAEEWWGRKREELLGRHFWTEFPGAVGSPSYLQHIRAMAERQPLRFEAPSALYDRWISVSIYPEENGGLSCYLQDITARKQAETERERLMAELSRSNEDLAQFSAVVSHDLQAPLRMVKSYARLLERRCGEQLDLDGQEFLRFVLDGAETMDTLIRGLLAYAQVTGADNPRTAVPLDKLVEGVLETLQNTIRETEATVTHDPLPTLAGDPVHFLQLFQNLIGNALKYRRAGVAPAVHIAVTQKKNTWLFSVSDNGMGIEKKHAEHIFLPLKRLHGGEISGAGIGLAVCKKIIERSGGQIWVESEVGVGSTFFFALPH